MPRTTPPPILDVTSVLPSLKGRERIGVLLHPEPAEGLPPDASKIGGRILWASEQEWPIGTYDEPFLSVLQLRKDEFPEVAFPEESDLLQVLWCPVLSEDEEWAPEVRVLWRTLASLNSVGVPSPSIDPETDLVPRECRVWPERIVEYPDYIELLDFFKQVKDWVSLPPGAVVPELAKRLVEGDRIRPERFSDLYAMDLSGAPGTKVGGYPMWIQDAAGRPTCDCGRKMEILITFASLEFHDYDTRWGEPYDRTRSFSEQQPERAPIGINFYDAGRGYLFYCPVCPDRPTSFLVQSS